MARAQGASSAAPGAAAASARAAGAAVEVDSDAVARALLRRAVAATAIAGTGLSAATRATRAQRHGVDVLTDVLAAWVRDVGAGVAAAAAAAGRSNATPLDVAHALRTAVRAPSARRRRAARR